MDEKDYENYIRNKLEEERIEREANALSAKLARDILSHVELHNDRNGNYVITTPLVFKFIDGDGKVLKSVIKKMKALKEN